MNRFIATLAALALAPAALAQDAQPAAPDTAAIEGKLTSLEEQYAETKATVAGLSKLRISGYLQARYGWAEANSFNNSANASPATVPTNQGFFIRRGRFKAVYDSDMSQYVLQIDVVPSGVSIKEGYAVIKLPAGLALDVGLQLFPFGYEVYARSSSDLDTLERSRVTRAFLGGEYDIGAALRGKVGPANFKLGVFNGNGIDAKTNGLDNDQLKDVIGRVWMDWFGGMLTTAVSGWYGKTIPYAREDDKSFDRYRVGADAQLYLDLLPIGGTALKGEYMWGRTTIGSAQSGAGGNLPGATSSDPVPTGAGWYAMLTQNIMDPFQLAVRYEQYMPDRTVDTATGNKVKVQTELQVALHVFIGEGGKFSLAYYMPRNGEKGPDAKSDPKQDQLIAQVQAKF
jgi:hypothetical protein